MDTVHYLNNAATTYPKPEQVTDAVTTWFKTPPVQEHRASTQLTGDPPVQTCRERLATLLNAPDPDRIILTSGATESLNMAIHGLSNTVDHVVTTQRHHNAVRRPLNYLTEHNTVETTTVSCTTAGMVDPDTIADAVTPETGLIIVTHASNVTGTLTDLDAVADIAADNDCYLLVDAAQSTGAVPFDVDGIDLAAFTGHKALYGLPGTGGLYVAPGMEDIMEPQTSGGTGVRSAAPHQPRDLPTRYEAGTPNLPGITALGAGAAHVNEIGVEHIYDHHRTVRNKLMTALRDRSGIRVHGTPDTPGTATVSITLKHTSPDEVGYILRNAFSIITRTGLHCAPDIHDALDAPSGTIRVSASYLTPDDAIDAFIDAITQITDA